jgi:hypothetical protein
LSTARFGAQDIELLEQRRELRIETVRPDGRTRRTVIWIVVDDGEVFVRSVRGDRGHWFQAAIDRPEDVALLVDKRRIPVVAVAAFDEDSIARCSAGFRRKYGERTQSARSMLLDQVLATTLRLEPR